MGLEQLEIEQIGHAQAAAAHLVFISWTDAPRRSADLYATGSILGCQFDHAMVGQDDMSAIADEQIVIDGYASGPQTRDFFQKRDRIEHNSIANHAATAGPEHSRGHKLQDELLAINDDGVTGIMTPGVTGYDGETLREHINNLAFALVA